MPFLTLSLTTSWPDSNLHSRCHYCDYPLDTQDDGGENGNAGDGGDGDGDDGEEDDEEYDDEDDEEEYDDEEEDEDEGEGEGNAVDTGGKSNQQFLKDFYEVSIMSFSYPPFHLVSHPFQPRTLHTSMSHLQPYDLCIKVQQEEPRIEADSRS